MRFSFVLMCVAACGSVKNHETDSGTDSFTCPANEFISCDGSMATSCNAAGDGTTTQDCGAAGCNADAKRCNQCAPNTLSCGTSTVDHCGPDGLPASQDTCAVGCVDAPMPHCAYLEPRYLPDACDAPATATDLTISASATFDTNLDALCNGGIVTQTGGPAICVLRYGTITIHASNTLAVIGPRAVAFVADTAVTIDGILDVSANSRTNGPGGGAISGGAASATVGGGGAGFRTAGAAGGTATVDGGGANGGGIGTDPSLLTALVGGTRPNSSLGNTIGGGGGGAATLIACRGTVSVAGMIAAGGGGGTGGFDAIVGDPQIVFKAGAGGGSGGNVVLQGLAITVTGQVFANGGGGGAGVDQDDGTGQAGADGQRSTFAAPGGARTVNEGIGGNGGAANIAPTGGGHPVAGTAGGGGGSIGFFQSYTPMGVTPTLTPSSASPGFSANKTQPTR